MLNATQEKLLSMLKWFHNYCLDNNIRYYAVGGTMIGAARHKGFIPWDDDIDVVVPRSDYKRLISTFSEKIGHYVLESPYSGNTDYLYSYAKLYDTDTTLTENIKRKCKRGLFIDVFPLDGIGDSEEEASANFNRFDRLNMFLMTRTCVVREGRSWYKNLSVVISQMIPSILIDDKKLSIDVDKLADSINKDDASFVANLMGAYRNKEIMNRELFGTPTLYQFESISVYGPEKFDEYLTHIYGNWRALPPVEKRKTNHSFVEFDLNKPYMQ